MMWFKSPETHSIFLAQHSLCIKVSRFLKHTLFAKMNLFNSCPISVHDSFFFISLFFLNFALNDLMENQVVHLLQSDTM